MGSSDWAIHTFTQIVEIQAGEMNIKIFISLAIVQTCVAGVMKEKVKKLETNEDSQEKVPYSPAGPVLDRSPQPPILSTNTATAQTLPSQIVFATEDNTEDQDQDPSYLLLTPLRQTKPFTPESVPSALPGRVYNPQLLVQNPSTGLSVQTLPSTIQFAKTTPKRPYVPGQNKQQFTKPWPADVDAPKYYLLRSVGQTKPFLPQVRDSLPSPAVPTTGAVAVVSNTGYNPQLLVNNPSTGISAQTLPSPIVFDQAQQEDPEARNFALLNPVRQTRPFPALFQTPSTFPQVVQYSSGDFFPGVSTRPNYPPGYSPAAVARTAQTQDIAGPKTVLYIL